MDASKQITGAKEHKNLETALKASVGGQAGRRVGCARHVRQASVLLMLEEVTTEVNPLLPSRLFEACQRNTRGQ